MKEELDEGEYVVKEYHGIHFTFDQVSKKTFDLKDLSGQLEKVFPEMVRLHEDDGFILVMDKIKVTKEGVVEGTGPVSERAQKVYFEFVGTHLGGKAGIWYVTNRRLIFKREVKGEVFPLNEMVNLELLNSFPDAKILSATFQRTGYEPEKFGIYIQKPEELQEILMMASEGKEMPELEQGITPPFLGSREKRREVIDRISSEAGLRFPIQESDCSPTHRVEINKLVSILENREARLRQAERAIEDQTTGAYLVIGAFFAAFFICILPIVLLRLELPIGGWFAWLIVVFVVWFLLVIPFRRYGKTLQQEHERATREAQKLWINYEEKASKLANSIKDYVLTTAATHVDFGQLLRVLKEKGIVIETIECPNCGGILKVSEVPKKEEMIECKYCGKSVLAINVFEKFKEILGL